MEGIESRMPDNTGGLPQKHHPNAQQTSKSSNKLSSILRGPTIKSSKHNPSNIVPACTSTVQISGSSGSTSHSNKDRRSGNHKRDEKVIGLKTPALSASTRRRRHCLIVENEDNEGEQQQQPRNNDDAATSAAGGGGATTKKVEVATSLSVEELEEECRAYVMSNHLRLLWIGNIAALKVFGIYLITLETVISCLLTAGLTCYFYFSFKDAGDEAWNGSGMDFVLLAFAVTSPISAALGMAFTRRERALVAIANIRSFSLHLYMAHCFWDWNVTDSNGNECSGRAMAAKNQGIDWVEHCDAVLAQLIGIGDELSRFLTLPNPSRTRHRMTRRGRKEAARTMEVAYLLLESMLTQRMARLIMYSERLKRIGLPSGEVSRMRQYERFISDNIEQLKMIKLYRTPQALRSFGRIFTVILPPFYSPSFAQLAIDTNSLAFGISFGLITAVCLTALFESVQVLEDPFTAYLALDGIDVREEFEVLHYAQMINTRKIAFPHTSTPYPAGRRAALTSASRINKNYQKHLIGLPPVQKHHERYRSGGIPSLVDITELVGPDDEEFTDKDHTDIDFDAMNDDHIDLELGTEIINTGENNTGGGGGGDYDQQSLVRETVFSDDSTMMSTSTHRRGPLSAAAGGLSRRRIWDTTSNQTQQQQQQPSKENLLSV